MNNAVSTAMRTAFDDATKGSPKAARTRLYAMVRSAISRKVGLSFRKSMWHIQRGNK